jgi:GntR family transcriptional regulator
MTTVRPGLPLYYRVSRALERRIETRDYRVGHRLPSEDALCREFQVSRITVRQAVGRLVESGLVVRRRGSGSYVVSQAATRAMRSITLHGTLEDLFAQVERSQVTSVRIVEATPPADVADAMGFPEGVPVSIITRVRAFDGEPFALTVNYLPLALGRRLGVQDLYRTPLLLLLEQQLGVRFTHAEQSLEARAADDEGARALGISFGDAVLYVERAMFDGGRHPVEIVRSQYRADRYRYRIRLVRASRDTRRERPRARRGA